MKIHIRAASMIVGALVHIGFAHAESFPDRALEWIVPNSAGSPIDAVARRLAEATAAKLGVPVIVENVPGAASITGTTKAAQSSPDGYTSLVGVTTVFTSNPHLFKNLPYDPKRDFVHISELMGAGAVLVVDAKAGIDNLDDFLAVARKEPGSISFGAHGVGSTPHLLLELLKQQAGVEFLLVQYPGSPLALQDILVGVLQATTTGAVTARPHLEAGSIKALVTTGPARSSALPDVPTFKEAGFEGPLFESRISVGISMPAGTPDERVDIVRSAVTEALADPEIVEFMTSIGFDITASTPEQFAEKLQAESNAIGQIVSTAGIEPQ